MNSATIKAGASKPAHADLYLYRLCLGYAAVSADLTGTRMAAYRGCWP